MDWVDILVPGAAILSLFGVAALIVHQVRLAGRLRRLEKGGAFASTPAADISLRRLKALEGDDRPRPGSGGRSRGLAVAGLAVLVLGAAGAGGWYFFLRDGTSDPAGIETSPPAAATTGTTTGGAPPPPPAPGRIPATVPPLENKAAITVAVYNTTDIPGAARNKIAPEVQLAGYQLGTTDDASVPDPSESVVMYAKGKRNAAWNVGKDLKIKRAVPLDGFDDASIGDVDVVVLVGLDLARG